MKKTSLLFFIALLPIIASVAVAIQTVTTRIVQTWGTDLEQPVGLPTTAFMASDGRIFIADIGLQSVQVTSPAGTLYRRFGEVGEGPGNLMMPFVMAINSQDELILAGSGDRVTTLSPMGEFLREFQRIHPDAPAKSIRVAPDGSIVIAAFDIHDRTTIDVYSDSGKHLSSFGESYISHLKGQEPDPRVEAFLGGGSLDVAPDGTIFFVQQVPFRLERWNLEGELMGSTSASYVRTFVGDPASPHLQGEELSIGMPASSVEVTVLGREVLVCSVRDSGDGQPQTILSRLLKNWCSL